MVSVHLREGEGKKERDGGICGLTVTLPFVVSNNKLIYRLENEVRLSFPLFFATLV